MSQLLLVNIPATGKPISKRKAPSVDRIKVNHELAKKRYYYHRRLKYFCTIDGANRTIDVPHKCFEDIPQGPRFYVGQLIGMGYNVQYKLL